MGRRLRQIQSSLRILGGTTALVMGSGVAALALSSSVGPNGIDARRLHAEPYNVTGAKIAIGQVEIGRPSQFGLDKVANADLPVNVRRVFLLDELAGPNRYVDFHAATVASVMVSQDKDLTGVAPNAVLYSAAVGPIRGRSGQPDECLSSQQIALSNGGDVRAINFSFGEPLARDPRPEAVLDGNALLTRCIDWSALEHDTLYVIAGNQGGGGIPIPTDNFNGINVAYSRRVDGRFTKVDFANLSSEPTFNSRRGSAPESNVGARRSINLVAPGSDIEVIGPDGASSTVSGTSFAAPHVVAAVALLQEWGDRQLRSGRLDWSLDSREPMVTKAVLLNSADKLEDAGDGLRLGMRRALYAESDRPWIESDAYRDRAIPLHADLGTGHLNAYRAVLQLDGGQWSPDETVPVLGWNYGAIAAPVPTATTEHRHDQFHDYVFEGPLQAGSYLSATLAWERLVALNDDNQNERYDLGESFSDQGLNNLDLYLMRVEDTDIADSVWSSVSAEDSVEHIFTQIPATGQYKLRVVYHDAVNAAPTQPYALAWWAVAAQQ
ncbi:MAG: S8 family serine peptidase [Leptolyngbyaceae cyanobacterium]